MESSISLSSGRFVTLWPRDRNRAAAGALKDQVNLKLCIMKVEIKNIIILLAMSWSISNSEKCKVRTSN